MGEEPRMQVDDSLTGRSEQEHRELIEFEKELRDLKAKKSEGPKLFQQLQEYLVRELRDANRRAGKNEYRLTFLKSRSLDLLGERCIRVEGRDRNIPPLTIAYSAYIHHMHFECGAKKCDYTLVVGDDGDLWFATSAHIRKTIQVVGTEMLKEIEVDNQVEITSSTRGLGVIRSWLQKQAHAR